MRLLVSKIKKSIPEITLFVSVIILKLNKSICKTIEYFGNSNKIHKIYFHKSSNSPRISLYINEYSRTGYIKREGRSLMYNKKGNKIEDQYYINNQLNGYQTRYNKYGQNDINYMKYYIDDVQKY